MEGETCKSCNFFGKTDPSYCFKEMHLSRALEIEKLKKGLTGKCEDHLTYEEIVNIRKPQQQNEAVNE